MRLNMYTEEELKKLCALLKNEESNNTPGANEDFIFLSSLLINENYNWDRIVNNERINKETDDPKFFLYPLIVDFKLLPTLLSSPFQFDSLISEWRLEIGK